MLKTRSESLYGPCRCLSLDLEHQPITLMAAVLHRAHLMTAVVLDRQTLAERVEALGLVEGRAKPNLVEKDLHQIVRFCPFMVAV